MSSWLTKVHWSFLSTMGWRWLMLHFCHCPGTTGSCALLAVFSYVCFFVCGSLGPLISFQEDSCIRGGYVRAAPLAPWVGSQVLDPAPLAEHSHSGVNPCCPKCPEVPECNNSVHRHWSFALGCFYLKSNSVLCVIIFSEVLVSKTFGKVLKSLPNTPVHKSRKEQ